MPKIIYPESVDYSLERLLDEVRYGKLQLPEFQRKWTWDDAHICGIVASLTLGYPMGAVMRLQCGGDSKFKARPIEGVKAPCEEAEYLVLDGQQRITSIYRAACSKDPVDTTDERDRPIRRFYYLDMAKCLDDAEERLKAVVSIPEDRTIKERRKVVFDLSTRELEYQHGMFPLNIVFDTGEREEWADGFKSFHGFSKESRDLYNTFSKEVLQAVSSYKLPVITLSKDTPKEAVCTVFENVNTGGVPLTVFELVTATYAAENFDLRHDWETRVRPAIRAENEALRTDVMEGVTETDFLTAVTLLAGYRNGGPVLAMRKNVLKLPYGDYQTHSADVVDGFRMARKFLLRQSVFRLRDLPYSTQVIPLAAVCAAIGEAKFRKPETQQILARWYWCGVLGEMYGSTPYDRIARDVVDLTGEILEGRAPGRTVTDSWFSAQRLLTLQGKGSAAYKGVMALVYKAGCRDFMFDGAMHAVRSMDENPDIHHIFPKDWCSSHGIPKDRRDSIVNKTPLLPETNRSIGGDAPSVYKDAIMEKAKIDEKELRARIESHFIDWTAFEHDEFQPYFVSRAKKLLDLIEGAMGKEVADRDSEQTRRDYGASLAKEAPAA